MVLSVLDAVRGAILAGTDDVATIGCLECTLLGLLLDFDFIGFDPAMHVNR